MKKTISSHVQSFQNQFNNIIYVDEEKEKRYKISIYFLISQIMDYILTQFIIIFKIGMEINPVVNYLGFSFMLIFKAISTFLLIYLFVRYDNKIIKFVFYASFIIMILINVNHFFIVFSRIRVIF